MKPSDKSEEMEDLVNELSKGLFGLNRTEAIEKNVCIFCKGQADSFLDEISKKEFAISGLCQKCQNEVFGNRDF